MDRAEEPLGNTKSMNLPDVVGRILQYSRQKDRPVGVWKYYRLVTRIMNGRGIIPTAKFK